MFYGSFNSNVAAWLLMPAMLFLIGSAQCLIGVGMGPGCWRPVSRCCGSNLQAQKHVQSDWRALSPPPPTPPNPTPRHAQGGQLAPSAWRALPLPFGWALITKHSFFGLQMPPTRIYPPLERITGFTFAYNCATVIGGRRSSIGARFVNFAFRQLMPPVQCELRMRKQGSRL